jgi:hypothetical protein
MAQGILYTPKEVPYRHSPVYISAPFTLICGDGRLDYASVLLYNIIEQGHGVVVAGDVVGCC